MGDAARHGTGEAGMVGERPGTLPWCTALRERRTDALLASVSALVPVAEVLVDPRSHPRSAGASVLVVVLLLVTGASLLMRRRAPVLVGAFCVASTLTCVALGDRSPLVAFGLTVALYSIGVADLSVRAVLLVSTATGGVFVVGVLLQSDRPASAHDLLHLAAVASPVVVGRLVAVQRLAAGLRTEHAALARQAEHDAQELRIEQERRRIARDLHDIVGHALTTITVQAGVAARLLDSRPEFARQALHEISVAGGEALRDLRGVVGTLRGSEHDGATEREPSLDDIEGLVVRARAVGVETTLSITGPTGVVPRSVQVTVFRVVQEALTNIRCHAGARVAAEVKITVVDGELEVGVRNEPGELPGPPGGRREGAGLVGMRERVAAVGGSLDTGPTVDGGFRVGARIPLPVPGRSGATA